MAKAGGTQNHHPSAQSLAQVPGCWQDVSFVTAAHLCASGRWGETSHSPFKQPMGKLLFRPTCHKQEELEGSVMYLTGLRRLRLCTETEAL